MARSGFFKRAQKLERGIALNRLLEEIRQRDLSSSERQRFLSVIMAKTVSRTITPREATVLSKAMTDGSRWKGGLNYGETR